MHRYRPHPWHGLEVGPEPPAVVNAFIEITPFDLMKYEVDKSSGYLKVDRPQRSSAQHPALYGFVPRTYCSTRVAKLAPRARRGDGDPLERVIPRPSSVREGLKAELRRRYATEAPPKLRRRAELLYVWFTRAEETGPS